MEDKLLEKAQELKSKISSIKSEIEDLENYKKNYDRHYSLEIKYIEKSSGLVGSIRMYHDSKDEELSIEIRACCDIIASYMLEIYKKRLDRLEFEYKNI